MARVSQSIFLIMQIILASNVSFAKRKEWPMSNGSVYRLAGANNWNCDTLPGYEEVRDLDQCKSFTRMTGKHFAGTERSSSDPIGCYANGYDQNAFYFNYVSFGGGGSWQFPLCFKNLTQIESTTESVLEKKMNEIINEGIRNISRQLEKNSEKLETIGQEVHSLKESIADLHSKDVSWSTSSENESTCQDTKIWCKSADCSLESVMKKCPKTCNIC